MRCPICNTKIVEGDMYCTNCGCKIEREKMQEKKNPIGKIVVAVVSAVLIFALIAGVVFFRGKDKDSQSLAKNEETQNTEETFDVEETDELEDEFELEDIYEAEPEVLTGLWVNPLYVMVNASSQLSDEPGIHYNVSNLSDDDPDSCWSEGVSGYGEGETITFMSEDGLQTARGLAILPGLLKSQKLFNNNGCPTEISVLVDGEKNYNFSLSSFSPDFDYPLASMLYCDFGKEIEFHYMIVTIEEVREGKKFKDTCISEMYLYK